MNFSQWLKENADILPKKFIDPDTHLFNKTDKTLAFFYSLDHKIYYANRTGEWHVGLLRSNPELYQKYKKMYDILNNSTRYADKARDALERRLLFGRIGLLNYKNSETKNLLVSFWNENPNMLNRLLVPCLNQLAQDGKIDKERDAFSTPNHKTQWIKDILPATEISPEDKEQRKRMLALHLMGPQEKMQQLKKQGWTPKQNFWQTSGFVQPGQKYWALNSENFMGHEKDDQSTSNNHS
jgi:hypothetical protein